MKSITLLIAFLAGLQDTDPEPRELWTHESEGNPRSIRVLPSHLMIEMQRGWVVLNRADGRELWRTEGKYHSWYRAVGDRILVEPRVSGLKYELRDLSNGKILATFKNRGAEFCETPGAWYRLKGKTVMRLDLHTLKEQPWAKLDKFIPKPKAPGGMGENDYEDELGMRPEVEEFEATLRPSGDGLLVSFEVETGKGREDRVVRFTAKGKPAWVHKLLTKTIRIRVKGGVLGPNAFNRASLGNQIREIEHIGDRVVVHEQIGESERYIFLRAKNGKIVGRHTLPKGFARGYTLWTEIGTKSRLDMVPLTNGERSFLFYTSVKKGRVLVHLVDLKKGRLSFKMKVADEGTKVLPLGISDQILVVSRNGFLTGLDLKKRKVAWTLEEKELMANKGAFVSFARIKDAMYFRRNDVEVVRISMNDGKSAEFRFVGRPVCIRPGGVLTAENFRDGGRNYSILRRYDLDGNLLWSMESGFGPKDSGTTFSDDGTDFLVFFSLRDHKARKIVALKP